MFKRLIWSSVLYSHGILSFSPFNLQKNLFEDFLKDFIIIFSSAFFYALFITRSAHWIASSIYTTLHKGRKKVIECHYIIVYEFSFGFHKYFIAKMEDWGWKGWLRGCKPRRLADFKDTPTPPRHLRNSFLQVNLLRYHQLL